MHRASPPYTYYNIIYFVSRQYLTVTSISPVSRAHPGFNPCVFMCRSWAGSCGGGFELILDRKKDLPKRRQFFTKNHIKNNCSGVPGDPGLFLDRGHVNNGSRPGARLNCPSPPSPAQPSPAQSSPAQPNPAQPSPARPSPSQPCPAQPSQYYSISP
jgi:hypothetical protein